jgi:ribonuclease BN (tRNA processing enzyme)
LKLTFLGTRGEIDTRSRRHRRHSALLVEYRGRRVMVDCGADWHGRIEEIGPGAIVLTHAHPDHAWGLRDGAPCGVWATDDAWESIRDYSLQERHRVLPEQPFSISGIRFAAFTVEHSTRCPAVGYRITAGRAAVWYAPDLVYIHRRRKALQGVDLYVGDGATLARSFVRKRGERLIGHSPVRTQLTWCQKEGVRSAVITHCGRQIVDGDERTISARVRRWGRERGVDVRIAHDGMERVLR